MPLRVAIQAMSLKYGGLSDGTSRGSGGLIGTIIDLIGLGAKKQKEPSDKNALGKAVSNLIGGENSPLPAKGMLSNVLYKALTAGSLQVSRFLCRLACFQSGYLRLWCVWVQSEFLILMRSSWPSTES